MISKFLTLISSGRLGYDSSIVPIFEKVLQNRPFTGYGFGSIASADFAYLEPVYISGLIGLTAYMLIYFYILFLSLFKALNNRKEAVLLFLIWTLLWFAALGAPSITANRVSIIIWILTTLIISIISRKNFNFKFY